LEVAQANGDQETVELLHVVLVSIENNLWFLEAYLEGIAVGLHGRKLPTWSSAFDNQAADERAKSVTSTGERPRRAAD
jgi:hypothetical protein